MIRLSGFLLAVALTLPLLAAMDGAAQTPAIIGTDNPVFLGSMTVMASPLPDGPGAMEQGHARHGSRGHRQDGGCGRR